jgi:hypothetical protein
VYLVIPGKCVSKQAPVPRAFPPEMPRERKERVFINPNPDEDSGAGDYQYGFYDKAHPVFGLSEIVKEIKSSLRGLRGEWIRMYVHASAKPADATDEEEARQFRLQRTFLYRNYTDVFGPGSAFASVVHWFRENHSDEVLAVHELEFEMVDEEEVDAEL